MHFDLADLRLFIHIAESPSLTQGARRAFPGRRQRGSRRSKASLAAACCIATAAASN